MQDISQLKRKLSEPFEVGNGVKQDCVLALTVFSIFLSMVLSGAFTSSTQDVSIQSRSAENLVNASLIKSSRKTRNILVCALIFADNTAFGAHSHQDTQEIITIFSKSAKVFGLKINLKKTWVMFQPLSGSHDIAQDIQREDQVLTQVNNF